MRRILCYILYLSGDDLTTCSSLPFSCPRNIYIIQQLPSPKLATLCPRKSLVGRWHFRFAFRPYFPGAFAVSFREGIYSSKPRRDAPSIVVSFVTCWMPLVQLKVQGGVDGWDGGKAADGGGSFGEKNTENSKRNHIFSVFDCVFIGQIHRRHSESMITTTAYRFPP